MVLDSSAVRAFELFSPTSRQGEATGGYVSHRVHLLFTGADTKGTVYATLNKCKTEAGKRLLSEK